MNALGKREDLESQKQIVMAVYKVKSAQLIDGIHQIFTNFLADVKSILTASFQVIHVIFIALSLKI